MAFDKPNIRVLFPVPFATVRVHDAEDLNARLLKEVSQRSSADKGITRSNRYGWHSEVDFFDRSEPAHAKLAREIDEIVAAVTTQLIPDMQPGFRTVHEGWVNVSPSHAMNAPHDHPGSFWSGTYYVHVPDPDDPGDRLSGAIEFIDPRGSIGSSARFKTPFTRSRFTVRPTAGTCLVWPSFVRHWVHPNNSAEERVTVAFNSRFVPATE